MEVEDSSTDKAKGEEERGKLMVVLLVGAPGSGKSTFCESLISSSSRSWVRICQDTIGNGKSGTRAQCLKSAASALKDGKSVLIDRCNMDKEQRADFVKLGSSQVDVHAVVLDLPAPLCISRSVKRTGHDGNLQGGKAAAVVNKMLQKKELPKLNEGFTRITFCQNESDVQSTLITYSSLGPSITLPHGCFGQKNQNAKVQLGIMKFLKKADDCTHAGSEAPNVQKLPPKATEIEGTCGEVVSSVSLYFNKELNEGEDPKVGPVEGSRFSKNVQTLAFPSISTSDFQFSLEKASEIIVKKVEEFMDKLGNSRLVLVDLSHRSKILSLVKAKASQRRIDSNKFLTFVGDITQLYSKGGLHCNVIANAANWRMKTGGGGVNAAIFRAAGPELEVATKEQAKSLQPGNAVVVPLPATSPLFKEEGVTHVIHVLGPNMNSQRPNCLNNDYNKGCQLLGAAYTSLFEGFLSLVRNQSNLAKDCSNHFESRPSESPKDIQGVRDQFTGVDQKTKRDHVEEFEKSKKCKGYQSEDDSGHGNVNINNKKIGENTSNAWGSWAQALYKLAMDPETHKDEILEISDDVVIINDVYPKAHRHVLILARAEGLDCLANVEAEHLQLLRKMHDVGLKWAEKYILEDPSLVFRLGYHSAPSMRQLHLHVISQDFDSKHLKNKKHWNSFNTAFFKDSVDVIDELNLHGKLTLSDDKPLMSMELRCNRCRSAHPNIPKLKLHISNCKSPFPSPLLHHSRLVHAPSYACD